MWKESRDEIRGTSRFFSVGLSHDTLANHYQTNFTLMQVHGYSLSELNEMIPWEREVYTALLLNHLKEQERRMKQQGL